MSCSKSVTLTRQQLLEPSIVWLFTTRDSIYRFEEKWHRFNDLSKYYLADSNISNCISYILQINDSSSPIFFLVDSKYSENIVSLVQPMVNVHRIYLYNDKRPSWIDQFSKAKDNFFSTMETLSATLSTELSIKLKNQTNLMYNKILNSYGETERYSMLTYCTLLNYIFVDIKKADSNNMAKTSMIEYLRDTYRNDRSQLKKVEQFDKRFTPDQAVYWYVNHSFLQTVLNRALWLPDPIMLYKLRYFIRCLNQEILSKPVKSSTLTNPCMFYCGKVISMEQFETLKDGMTDGLLSFNNFLSARSNRDEAMRYAQASLYNLDQVSILFSIHIDLNMKVLPFTEITGEKYKQILFAIGTVFLLENISQLNQHVWEAKLKLSDQTNESIMKSRENQCQQIFSIHPLVSLVKLVTEMNQFQLPAVLKEFTSSDNYIFEDRLVHAESQLALGSGYKSINETKNALAFFKNGFTIRKMQLLEEDSTLSRVYFDMGCCYEKLGDFSKALEHYQIVLNNQLRPKSEPDKNMLIQCLKKTAILHSQLKQNEKVIEILNLNLSIQSKYVDEKDPTLCDTYLFLAETYLKLKDSDKANFYREKAMLTSDKTVPESEFIGKPEIVIGQKHLDNLEFDEAIQHFESALQRQKNHTPFNPQIIAVGYYNLAKAYSASGNRSKALMNYYKALDLEIEFYPADHPTIAITYHSIAAIYSKLNNVEKTFEFLLNSINQLEKQVHPNPQFLRQFLAEIGILAQKIGKPNEAIKYLEKASNISSFGVEDKKHYETMASLHFTLAMAYQAVQKYSDSLTSLKITLGYEQSYLTDDDPSLAVTLDHISLVYERLSQNEDSLKYAKQVVEQLKKRPDNHSESLINCLERIGRLLMTENKHQEAIETFKEMFSVMERRNEEPDKSTAIKYYRLAESYEAIDDFTNAFEFFEKTLEIERKYLSDNHSTIATTLLKMSDVQMKLSNFDQVIKFGCEALAQFREQSDPKSEELLACLLNVSKGFEIQEKYSEAIPYVEEALSLMETMSMTDPRSLSEFSYKLGQLCSKCSHLEKALDYLKKAVENEQKLSTELVNSDFTASVYQALADVYVKLGKFDEALDACQLSIDYTLRYADSEENELQKRIQYSLDIKLMNDLREAQADMSESD